MLEENSMPSVNRKLNLGCGNQIKRGYLNLDRVTFEGVDLICDLEQFYYPFKDNVLTEINCNNILEHQDDLVHVMEELHGIAKPRARIIIKAPHFTCQYGFADPTTHKQHFTYESFDYFLSNDKTSKDHPDWYTSAEFSLISKKNHLF